MFSNRELPFLRPATPADYDAIFDIWMQTHVNPFMSFEIMTKEAFKPIFDEFEKEGDIYVIQHHGQVVAVQRLCLGAGVREHVAEYASFGVHEEYLRKGYGSLFYRAFQELIETKYPHIKRIELSQESDNDAAQKLVEKMGFQEEAYSPDWLSRITGTHRNKWFVGERFYSFFIEPSIKQANQAELKPFMPQLPPLNVKSMNLTKTEQNGKITVSYQGKPQATCHISAGVRRYEHIAFLAAELIPGYDPIAAQAFFRELAVVLGKQYKKIELCTSDHAATDFFATLGFHCRGEKIASHCLNGRYGNEMLLDFGMFNINDAKRMLLSLSEKTYHRKLVNALSALNQCRSILRNAHCNGMIDDFSNHVISNLAYQITREGFSDVCCYTITNSPWATLIDALPIALKASFTTLAEVAGVIEPRLIEEEVKVISYNRK